VRRPGAADHFGADPQAALLRKGRLDFSGALLVVSRLVRDIEDNPTAADHALLDTLAAALDRAAYRRQKQAYFLYREAAGGLAALAAGHPDPTVGTRALCCLERRLGNRHNGLHRATAEALGGLPLAILPPLLADGDPPAAEAPDQWPELSRSWLRAQGVDDRSKGRWLGRSLLLDAGSRGLVVVKFMRRDEGPAGLAREARWMRRLAEMRATFAAPFEIPVPLGGPDSFLMRWTAEWPLGADPPPELHPDRGILVFATVGDYFSYPNLPAGRRRLSANQVCETLGRCACLLGQALACDLVHTAPIPLFHNRTQQHRRTDGGHYDWPRAGRMDQWLHSCRYPNMARSGLRDFEHFRIRTDTAFSRYEWIGVHLISLFLVAGSYFRTAAPQRAGSDAAGNPVDARDLFDPVLLGQMIRSICLGYRRGFVGGNDAGDLPFDLAAVVPRMIEEMGVDRHMEEVLRAADQRALSRAAFENFLTARGVAPDQAAGMSRGEADIVLQTGPHLGGFNQPISLPELIHMTGAMAADCVARRFRRERGWPSPAVR
jgi:hypothetical protein